MSESFRQDDKIRQIAEAYSRDAVDWARNNHVKLDFSEKSIEAVEAMLRTLHDQLATAKPSEETIWTFAKAFGSYVGEVYRKHHGGEWGIVCLGDQEFPGICAKDARTWWPWGRVFNRLVEGSENNVLHYYMTLTKTL